VTIVFEAFKGSTQDGVALDIAKLPPRESCSNLILFQ